MSDSFAIPWTVAHQALLSMGFPRQETGVGCHFLLQGFSLLKWDHKLAFFFFQMATEFTQYYLLKICFHLDHIWHFYKWGHFSPLNSIQCNLSTLVLFITSALTQTLIALIPSSWTSAFPWFLWKNPLLSFHMNFRIKFWKFCLRYYYYTVFTDYILWTSRYLQYETKTTL